MTADKNLQNWLEANGGSGTHFDKTHYVAHVVGEHDEYDLEREFISYKIDSSYSGKTGRKAIDAADLVEGGVYEIRYDSWGNKKRRLVQLTDIKRNGSDISLSTTELSENEAVNIVSNGKAGKKADLRREIQDALKNLNITDLKEVNQYVQQCQ